ncbi:2-hydroxyacyl-CoA dehydratase subunit D [Anaeromicropila herbilytica]|uniref:2-hydroxyacyl-CoA dehydratase,D-component n=1 Tax=Anaeromicropila herbilytica TaxID=2785025 RepID=A0A7R7ICV2_9FIRM|nr:2-hydroxyacyl-CoA dehydratase family protein [Anaeromicropila herbilytica]BCN31143.1 2-hydroxyacyl-CoA dehydratase,D-component [Anaeromicropila herbilytica]
MQIIKKYGEQIKKNVDANPKKALNMIKLGLDYENIRTKVFPDKGLPRAYQKLNHMAVNSTLKALKCPEKSVWTNIFTPVEIIQCFGLNPISLECLSSFISGFQCEDYFIDYAENSGIAPTLCSYHKNFIGAVDSGVLPKPVFSVTTSMVCDGNINTFRYLTEKHQIAEYMLDIPHEYSIEAESYVVEQLKEMIVMLEEKFQMKLDMNELKETLKRENESKAYYKQFLKEQIDRYYPNTLTMNLFMLFATHLNIGTKEALDFFQLLAKDIKKYPKSNGTSLFWVHLFPYYQETLKSYFNCNEDYQIKACDLNLDYMEELDIEHPLETLAKKMILNIYNGSFERKVELVSQLVKEYKSDALIHFCHWGCKQSSGGVMLLKEEMKKLGVPMLILDGDGMDRRNSHDGQIKTRLEAFLEMIETGKDDIDDRLCV